MSGVKLSITHMAELIKQAITEDGLTQAELARRVGMTEKHISQVLTGTRTASVATLDYWAFVLGRRFHVTLEIRDE